MITSNCEFILSSGQRCDKEMGGKTFVMCHFHRELKCDCGKQATKYCEYCEHPICDNEFCRVEHIHEALHLPRHEYLKM